MEISCSSSFDIHQCNRLITSVIMITVICTQYMNLIMTQPEAHEIPTRRTPAHWRNKEIIALVNHMYDNRASGDTSGNFKPQVYTSALTVINDDPNLQPLQIGTAKTIKMVKSKWASVYPSNSILHSLY